ncbi:cAMP phosphodiesterase [Synechococcus sp. RSCCF101]|nr:cAMP phosphodiesterase [Synechococcus sp. RSCCF101]
MRPLLVASLLLSPLALPGRAEAAPATREDMTLYTRIAAINVCISRAAKVDFDTAVSIAGETIAQVLKGQHQGQIAQVGTQELSIDELRKGSINSAVIGAVDICPDEVPAEVKTKVQEAIQNNGGG